jgi:amino acid transporter
MFPGATRDAVRDCVGQVAGQQRAMTSLEESTQTRVARGIHELAPGVFEITSEPPPHGRLGRIWHRLRRILIGRPLSSRRERTERLSWLAALAVLGADAIASSVYGPEEMLRMLSQAGLPAVAAYAMPIAVSIVVLLILLTVSYWQTIAAYPNGAGGYIVASDNLGPLAGVVSAAALLVDYTLDVAVSIATGIETMTSAAPILAPWKVPLALIALVLITLANLRGIRAAGALLSAPIYLYIFGTAAVIGVGLFEWSTGTLPPYTPPAGADQLLSRPVEVIGLLLLLRAFSSGAVALTGIEAISNGVPYFKLPETRNAHRTLAGLALSFGALFLGISFLSGQIGIIPDPAEVETVHSQLTRTVLGPGVLHFILEGAALLLLILAADTGFADFPRLMALLARDGYLPEAFAVRGARLAFSNGIVLVAAISAVLIMVFRGSVTALVPLFTVGAFATFTLSQAGMARHWLRLHGPGWHWRMAVNGIGAMATAIVLIVVVVSKFAYGAWIVVVILPLLVLTLRAIGQHHARLLRHVQVSSVATIHRVLATPMRHHAVIPVEGVNLIVLQAVRYARTLNGHVEAVHVTDDLQQVATLRQQWDAARTGIPLVILDSPVRAPAGALMRYLDFVQKHEDPHTFVTVILPELLPTRWWHPLLHNYFAWRLKWMLLFRPRTAVTCVPYAARD